MLRRLWKGRRGNRSGGRGEPNVALPRLEQLEDRELLDAALHYVFGTGALPGAGEVKVADTTPYSPVRGYGWQAGGVSFGAQAALTGDASFAVDVANGTYKVTVTLGDDQRREKMQVSLEGGVVGTVDTPPKKTATVLKTLSVSDGQLNLRLADIGGATSLAALGRLDLVPVGGPTGIFGASGSVNEGSTGAATFSGVSGGSGGYRYSYDFNNDGTFEISNSTSPTAAVPASYLDDGAGARVVRGRLSDSAGAYSDYTATVTINNVAPSASFTGPSSGGVGQSVSFTGSGDDPSNADRLAGLRYGWDFGDGGSGSGAAGGHVYAAPGVYTVRLTVSDKDGGQTVRTGSITITAGLSGTFTGTTPVNEGGTGTVTFSHVSGGSGGYTYSYDFDNDGAFEIVNSASASAAVPASYLDDGAGSRVVHGRVSDSAGAYLDYTTTITISNVAPTPGISGPSSALTGATVAFTGSATDPSSADTRAGFTYAWDFGDGASGSGPSASHAYGAAGTYTVSLKATDKDGGWATVTHTVTVSAQAETVWVEDGTPAGASLSGQWNWVSGSPAPFSGALAHQSVLGSGVHQEYFQGASQTLGAQAGDSLFAYVYLDPANPPQEVMLQWNDGSWEHRAYWGANLIGWGTDGTASRRYLGGLPAAGQWVRLEVPAAAVGLEGRTLNGLAFTLYDGRATWDRAGKASPVGGELGADFGNGGPADEGSAGAVSFTNVRGGSGGYTFSYDFDNDGAFEIVNSASASAAVPASYLDDGAGSRVVHGRVSDSTGASRDYTTTITVSNVAPTPSISGPTSALTGATVTFAGSATDPSAADTRAGFTYAWDFGDGASGSGPSASHAYAAAGTYTVSLKATDKDGGWRVVTSRIVIGNPGDPGDFIDTGYDKIPNFGAHPTIVSAHSGAWSDPTTWSLGRVPVGGDVVSINTNDVVTYDMVSDAVINTVVVQPGGHLVYRTDVNTRLTAINVLVLEQGELQIGTQVNPVGAGVKAETIFADVPIDTVKDPSQYGNGLIGLGKVTMHGAVKSDTFLRLAVEPRAGDTTLTLAQAVPGWRVGDRLVLPDSRQLGWNERDERFVGQWELVTVQAISADGRTLTLTSPLQFAHVGARNGDGVLEYLPHVGNLTRNVVIRSQNARGTRGHVMFTKNAEVDIRYTAFNGLGRTRIDATDDTTYDAQGNVTHVGTNQSGRYPIQFRHLVTSTPPASGQYRYTFVGNAVMCPVDPMPFKWGIAINDSDYGLIKDNVLYNWAGAGIMTEAGTEDFNVFDHNFVVRVTGNGASRADTGLVAREGSNFWFMGTHNYVRNNVAANGALYEYTFYSGGPFLEVAGNEAYGGRRGLTMWEINGAGSAHQHPDAPQSTIQSFVAWHNWEYGIGLGYPIINVTFDGLVVRGDAAKLDGRGWSFGDYLAQGVLIRNANIQGMRVGIEVPLKVGQGGDAVHDFTIQDSYLRNYFNIWVGTIAAPGGGGGPLLDGRHTIIRDVRFASLVNPPPIRGNDGTLIAQSNISMVFDGRTTSSANWIQDDIVDVYNYNGIAGDNFRVYYKEQVAGYIVPQTQDGSVGAPEAGLTNQQAWARYGIAIGGAVAPLDASQRSGIDGLINPL